MLHFRYVDDELQCLAFGIRNKFKRWWKFFGCEKSFRVGVDEKGKPLIAYIILGEAKKQIMKDYRRQL